MPISYKLIYRFIAILIKIPAGFSVDIDKFILKCMWKYKEPRVAKTVLGKKRQTIYRPWFQDLFNSYSKQDCVVLAQG